MGEYIRVCYSFSREVKGVHSVGPTMHVRDSPKVPSVRQANTQRPAWGQLSGSPAWLTASPALMLTLKSVVGTQAGDPHRKTAIPSEFHQGFCTCGFVFQSCSLGKSQNCDGQQTLQVVIQVWGQGEPENSQLHFLIYATM